MRLSWSTISCTTASAGQVSVTSRGISSAEELHLTLQAALEVACEDKLVVTAAAAAHAKQDRTAAAATGCPGSTQAAVRDIHPPSTAAQPKKANAAAATEPQALAPKPNVTAPDVAAQVAQGREPADAQDSHRQNPHTAGPVSAAASRDTGSPTAPHGPIAASDGPAAPSSPAAPGGPTGPAPDGPIAPAGPPASTTKKSSKKRKQAKQLSKSAASGTASQRKRKKASGSKIAAAGAGTDAGHQGEARTSVSTLEYAVGEPSSTPHGRAGHDGEVASPNKDRTEQHEDTDLNSEKNRPQRLANTLPSQSLQHLSLPKSSPEQHPNEPMANPKPHPAAPELNPQQLSHEFRGSSAAHQVGSFPAKHTLPPQEEPAAQEAPLLTTDTHIQVSDPAPGDHPPQQQSSSQADDRTRQSAPGNAVGRHGVQQQQDTAQQPQELPQQQQQQQQHELSQQQQQQQSSKQPQQPSAGQLAQPTPGDGLTHAQEKQLTAAETEWHGQTDAEVIREHSA